MAASHSSIELKKAISDTPIPIELNSLKAMLLSLEQTFPPQQRISLINDTTGPSYTYTMSDLIEVSECPEDYVTRILCPMDLVDVEAMKFFFQRNPKKNLYLEISCFWLQAAIAKESKPQLATLFASYLELGASPSMQLPVASISPMSLAEGMIKYDVIDETFGAMANNKSHFTEDEYNKLQKRLAIDKRDFENALSLLEVVLYYCRSLKEGWFTMNANHGIEFSWATLATDLFTHLDHLCTENVALLGDENQSFRLLEKIYQREDLLPFKNSGGPSLREKVLSAWRQGVFTLSDHDKIHILALAADMGAEKFNNLWNTYHFRPNIPPERDPSRPNVNPAEALSMALFRAYEREDSDLVCLLLGIDGIHYPNPSSPLGCGLLDINSRDASQNTLLSLCEARAKQTLSLQDDLQKDGEYLIHLASAKLLLQLGASPWLVPIDSVSSKIEYMPLCDGQHWSDFFLAFYQRLKGDILANRYRVTLNGQSIQVTINIAGDSYRCSVPSGVACIFRWMERAARYHVLYNTQNVYEAILKKLDSVVDIVRSAEVTDLYLNFIYLFKLNFFKEGPLYNFENTLSSKRTINYPEGLEDLLGEALKHPVIFSPAFFHAGSTPAVPSASSSDSMTVHTALNPEDFSFGLRRLMELGVFPSEKIKMGIDKPRPFLEILKTSSLLEKGQGAYWLEGLTQQKRDSPAIQQEITEALAEIGIVPNFFNHTLQVSMDNKLDSALTQLFIWQALAKRVDWEEELIRVFNTLVEQENVKQCLKFLEKSYEHNPTMNTRFLKILCEYSSQLQQRNAVFLVEVACQYDAPDLIKSVLSEWAFDLNKTDAVMIQSKNRSGLASVLHLAVFHCARKMVQWLLEQDVDPNNYNDTWGTALHIIATRLNFMRVTPKQQELFKIMRILGDFGASPWISHEEHSAAKILHDANKEAHTVIVHEGHMHSAMGGDSFLYCSHIRNEKALADMLCDNIKKSFILNGKEKITEIKAQPSFLKKVVRRMEGDIIGNRYPAGILSGFIGDPSALVTINQQDYSVPKTVYEIYMQLRAWRDDRISDMDRSFYSRLRKKIEGLNALKGLDLSKLPEFVEWLLRNTENDELYNQYVGFLELNAPFSLELDSADFQREGYSSQEDGIDVSEDEEHDVSRPSSSIPTPRASSS